MVKSSFLYILEYDFSIFVDAKIVDFFAGSGTTLHAVNLLNSEDGGNRRCILVTNNEVANEDAEILKTEGFKPGDQEWERHGICKSVTWPRTTHSILGRLDDGTSLSGEYFAFGLFPTTIFMESLSAYNDLGNVNALDCPTISDTKSEP